MQYKELFVLKRTEFLFERRPSSKKKEVNCPKKIGQLKLKAEDGKSRITDVADSEQLFRLIQSIPSPKAEPFKIWLAKIASERLDEMQDPELTIDRALEQYLRLGYLSIPVYWIESLNVSALYRMPEMLVNDWFFKT